MSLAAATASSSVSNTLIGATGPKISSLVSRASSGTSVRTVGPLVDAKGREKVVELVGDAVGRGATVRVGGEPVDGPGWFYRPTVLTDVPLEARLTKEEIFGPVAPISVFDTDDEAVAAANDTEFGLVSYLFTENVNRALRVSEALESGMVGLNTGLVSNPAAPFGGIKQSGLGREGGAVGIEEYLETKYVAVGLKAL